MNYRHAFHAGNFADVFKHAVLVDLLEAMTGKPSALAYVESHAGAGCYRLDAAEAGRTGEYHEGIERLLQAPALPTRLARYLALVRAASPDNAGAIRVYPGSPVLAAALLRAQDRLVLCELQEAEAGLLRAQFAHDARVAVHRRDGYEALKALLPPKQKRGLVLIDPPYEAQEQEFRAIERALGHARTRFAQGTFAIWYPIKLRQHVRPFHRWLSECGASRVLAAELLVHPDDVPLRLNGCGMAIINPPFRLEAALAQWMPALAALLRQGPRGGQQLIWLKNL